jgi:hypothetical protein
MKDQSSPEMSVVIVTDRYQTIRKTLRHLRTQTVKDHLEVVIVAPSAEQLDLDDSELKDFLQVRVVEIGTLQSLSWARAAGVREAGAPVVGFVESHSYPAPGWAEALIEAHRQPWAAVGPAVSNANPKTAISWAGFLLDYGRWLEPAAAGEIDDLPGHNSSYKRHTLLNYGSELEAMLEAESMLHQDLRAQGYRLYLEPRAKIMHLNISLLSSWIPERYHAGRRFAAARARLWSPLRRLLYVGGSPLIPLVRLPRILGDIRRSASQRDLLPKVLPALIASLIVSAVGEMIGYAFRSGDSMEKLSRLELNKIPHLAKRDNVA